MKAKSIVLEDTAFQWQLHVISGEKGDFLFLSPDSKLKQVDNSTRFFPVLHPRSQFSRHGGGNQWVTNKREVLFAGKELGKRLETEGIPVFFGDSQGTGPKPSRLGRADLVTEAAAEWPFPLSDVLWPQPGCKAQAGRTQRWPSSSSASRQPVLAPHTACPYSTPPPQPRPGPPPAAPKRLWSQAEASCIATRDHIHALALRSAEH